MTKKHHPTLFKCKHCGYTFDKVGKEETHRKTYREVNQNQNSTQKAHAYKGSSTFKEDRRLEIEV